MPLRICADSLCSQAADRSRGSCRICFSHFCTEHFTSPSHGCPTAEKDAGTYFAALDNTEEQSTLSLLRCIDAAALASLASGLRSGVPCHIPVFAGEKLDFETAASQMGGQNMHVNINFDDGITWLARFRRDDSLAQPAGVQDYIFLSEVSTLKFLESTLVPAPKVFHYAVKGPGNPIGATFLLMEKFQGSPFDWQGASAQQRTKVMEQVADIVLELEKHPFESMGSLCMAADGLHEVGAFAEPVFFMTLQSSLGPFPDLASSLTATTLHQMELISNGELAPFAVDNYLSQRWRLSMVPKLASPGDQDQSFYLKHGEDKGDHIIVDEDYNIVGIIDWEFSCVEPTHLAFSSPCMMWPLADFYDGRNNLSPEELEFAGMFERRGRPDMAAFVRNGRGIQRFTFTNGGGVAFDRAEFEALFQGLRAALLEEGKELESYTEWKEKALEKYGDDEKLQLLLQRAGTKSP